MLKCIYSGDKLQAHQRPGCGSLVLELMKEKTRQLRFKLTSHTTNTHGTDAPPIRPSEPTGPPPGPPSSSSHHTTPSFVDAHTTQSSAPTRPPT